ncbi:type I-E CRISPR-associated protein Cse1/CasA [Chitinivorax sp. PXF-14]|uniref:type I-E CRISPR-associated protein Cse1/CasA n=1 Tax=Chitinivorax sp. PXF-14 TaxID=3230488 RepID=UPI0034663A1C
MKLLVDPFIPVADGQRHTLVTLRHVLCTDNPFELVLPRDDMELACLQLIICLVQAIFPPRDVDSWWDRLDSPMDEVEFDAGIAPYLDWFDLDHPTQPFMQARGVKAGEPTPVQKLLVGLPEGNNHAFFNDAGEVTHLSPPAAAIALFNQASCAPNFGGGFKGALRGVPITTLIAGEHLRDTVWRNVLHEESLRKLLPAYDETRAQPPVWVKPIQPAERIHATSIGLLRGLFWQPARVELMFSAFAAECGLLDGPPQRGYAGFNKEKFVFDVQGLWPHPHSPSEFEIKKNEKTERCLAFTTIAPAWTQCSRFLFEHPSPKEGSSAAAVVRQWRSCSGAPLRLIVGGYRNKQASVIERRHELFSIAAGWSSAEGGGRIERTIQRALDYKKLLRGKLYRVVKGDRDKHLRGVGGALQEIGEERFYHRTEPLIHRNLSEPIVVDEFADFLLFNKALGTICRNLFDEMTEPYTRDPILLRTVALARVSLNNDLKPLEEGQ